MQHTKITKLSGKYSRGTSRGGGGGGLPRLMNEMANTCILDLYKHFKVVP